MIIAHHVITNPSAEKINELNIQGPYFIYSVYNNTINDELGISTFKVDNQSFYYFTNKINKNLVYTPDMLPTNYENINTIFVTEILKL